MATPIHAAPPGTDISDAHLAPVLHSAVLAAATADNTRRVYRSAVNHYLAWGGVLPADEAAIIPVPAHLCAQPRA